jgi:hypothetical protein
MASLNRTGERLLWFAFAFRSPGNLAEAFTHSTQLLNLDPSDTIAMLLIVTVGPSPAPI